MISFLNQDVREEFHLLPLDSQRSIQEAAEFVSRLGKTLIVLFIDQRSGAPEITLRIDETPAD